MSIECYFKLKNIFKQIFYISFSLFLFSIFLIGIPIFTNNYSIETIDIDYAELQVIGKHSDPVLNVVDGKKIISGDCYVSLGKFCNKYQYKSLFGVKNKILIINDKYSIILYSEIVDGNKNKFVINNIKIKNEIIDNMINRKKFFPRIFLFFSIFSLIGFFLVHLYSYVNKK